MKAYKGVLTAPLGTGDQTVSGIVDEDGNAFTPKAVLIWGSYQTAAGFSDTNGYQISSGLMDGTTQAVASFSADDNTSPNDTSRTILTTRVIHNINPANTILRSASYVSFGSGQFVINWATVDGVAALYHYVALGGSDLSVVVEDIDSLTGQGSGTALPLADAGFFWGGVAAGDACNGPNYGWMAQSLTGGITQGASAAQIRDNQASSIVGRYQRTNRCFSVFTATAQTIFVDGQWTNVGWNKNPGGTTGIDVLALWLRGIAAKAGSGLQPTSTGTQAITGVGFKPKIVFLLSVGQTAQTTVQTECRMSLGAADRTRQGWMFCGANDGVNPSVVVGGHNESNIVTCSTPNATGSSTTTEAQASLQSMDLDGFTLNWGTADATQREYLWLALGDGTAPISVSIGGSMQFGGWGGSSGRRRPS